MTDGPINVPPIEEPVSVKPKNKKERKSKVVAVDNGQEESKPASKPPTKEEVEAMLLTVGSLMAAFVDEKFWPFEMGEDEKGEPTIKGVKPNIKVGAEQMMPWMERYGTALDTLLVWTGLISGIGIAYQDGLREIPQYVIGNKKPIFMRDGDPVESKKKSGGKASQQTVEADKVTPINKGKEVS